MEYTDEELGVTFTLPDKIPVKQQLLFRGRLAGSATGDDFFIRYWEAAVSLIEDWKCEDWPAPLMIDLETETDARITDLIQFVSNSVAKHMNNLERTPKN